jgi:phosphoribosylamine--glycine ligase
MRLLVIGQGGREHAICWRLAQSASVTQVYCAPGNPGIAEVATCVPVAEHDVAGLIDFARAHAIDLSVVGPEAPLLDGLVDAFEAAGLTVFGPRRDAALLEGSKSFAKALMHEHGIPGCPAFEIFADLDAASPAPPRARTPPARRAGSRASCPPRRCGRRS